MYDDDDYLDSQSPSSSPESTINTTQLIAWAVAILLFILTVFHFIQWRKGQSNESLMIQQQSIDEVDRISIDSIDQPLVIDYIEDDTLEFNMLEYRLYSPLGLFKHYTDIDMSAFTANAEHTERHYHAVYAIKPDTDIVVVYQTPDKQQTSFIVVHPHNILIIPRWGHWRIDAYDKITGGSSDGVGDAKLSEIRVETYTIDTPWTKMYRAGAKVALYLGFTL